MSSIHNADSQNTAQFKIRNVFKRPPDTNGNSYILSDLSFEIYDNEIFTILGPSGAGKSTLLRLLNALDEPSKGEILFEGQSIRDIDIFSLRKKVGMVFQRPALLPGTVKENLSFPREIGNASSSLTNETLLERVGLSAELLSRDASALSVGQQQRVMIARALINEPDVLLMDEPTSALDPAASKRILHLVKELKEEYGHTIVYVTHNMPEAREIADRVLLLVDGSVKVISPAESFFSGESSELAEKFLAGELENNS